MENEVFEGRSEADFVAVIERLRAEGRTQEADQVLYLLGAWKVSHGLGDSASDGAGPDDPARAST